MTIENKEQLNKALHDMREEVKANGLSVSKVEKLAHMVNDGYCFLRPISPMSSSRESTIAMIKKRYLLK